MKKTAVIFDMDGLLIDSETVYYKGYVDKGNEFGIEISKDIFRNFLGKKIENIIGEINRMYENMADGAKIVENAKNYMMDIVNSDRELPLKKGALDVLESLKSKGYILALATSNYKAVAEKMLLKTKTYDYFEVIIYGDNVKHGKPAPDIFLKCLKKLQVSKEEAVVLEDSENGVLAAHNAGIDVICVPDMVYPREEIAEKAAYIAKDLYEAYDFIIK